MNRRARGERLLLIEDEVPIRRFLRASLERAGYRVGEAGTGEDGLNRALAEPPDLVVLDLNLPDVDGMDVLGRLREWSRAPVVVLSARGHERDKVTALDAGADDYLTKPFGVGELLARVRVALRHAAAQAGGPGGADASVHRFGDVEVDLGARIVRRGGAEVAVTPREWKLLTTLLRHAGKVLTHRFLLREVWGPHDVEQVHYLRVYMARLRRKLEEDPARPRWLRTEQGVGYRLMDE